MTTNVENKYSICVEYILCRKGTFDEETKGYFVSDVKPEYILYPIDTTLSSTMSKENRNEYKVSRPGYVLKGWKTDPENPGVDDLEVAASLEWQLEPQTLTLNWNYEGSTTTTIEVTPYEELSSAIQAYIPKREGYEVLGWYQNAACTTPLEETTMPLEALTIYAKWARIGDLNGDGKVNAFDLAIALYRYNGDKTELTAVLDNYDT